MDSHEHHHDHAGHAHSGHGHGASCCGADAKGHGATPGHSVHGTSSCTDAPAEKAPQHDVVRDPVCGMIVDPNAGKPTAEHGGHTFHFCSAGCKAKFEADPQRYLAGKEPPAPMPRGTQWTCP